MSLWDRAGRLVGVEPPQVARRGLSRPPTQAEAAAMLEAAVAALEAAGVPVRVANTDEGAVVLIRGAKWRRQRCVSHEEHEKDTDDHHPSPAAAVSVQSKHVRCLSSHAHGAPGDGDCDH